MRNLIYTIITLSIGLLLLLSGASSQTLKEIAQQREIQWKVQRAYAESLAILKHMPIRVEREDGATFELQRFQNNLPIYYTTCNINAAKTISTDKVWPSGGLGFSLTGSNIILGEWDAGAARSTHQEFGTRVLSTQGSNHYHSTHVAGTMMASGVTANALGMSPQAFLKSYDWNNDASEMATQAAGGLRVSNHSYINVTGWYWNLFGDSKWAWFGDLTVSAIEDYKFGFYDEETQLWDQIARNAPYYLIVQAVGNDRNEGPSTKVSHWIYVNGQWILQDSGRNKDGNDGYDCTVTPALAKNILTVGAVDDLPNGYTNPLSVAMSSFSNWGPTDDGRIKPDIVANGINLYSTLETADNAYGTYSGTSMATPNVSGSVGLLLHLQEQLHGSTPLRSSTMKAIILHTADEAGLYPGPDYKFGWGLMNTFKAASIMKLDNIDGLYSHIREIQLNENDTIRFDVGSNGIDTLKATICWTDPAAIPPDPALDPPTKMLVNDVDLRIFKKRNNEQYEPWILNPASPSSAATLGDNITDNVEQIVVTSTERTVYTVQITHKGALNSGIQHVSIVISGNIIPLGPVYEAQQENFEYMMIPDGVIIDSVKIKNFGDSLLTLHLEVPIDYSGWLTVTEDSISVASMDSAYIRFTVDANTLNTWTTYPGLLSILHNDSAQTPSEIYVTVNTLGPTITRSHAAFSIDVDLHEIGRDTLRIRNAGYTPLFFSVADTGKSLPDWLTMSSDSATIAPGDSVSIELKANEINLPQGDYTSDLKIESNDNQTGIVFIPVILHIGTRRTVTTDVKDFWNLISTPVRAIDNRKANLYPTATSSAWDYNSVYSVAESLWAGKGYWLKFDSEQTLELEGYIFDEDTLALDAGWHIIGALSSGIPTSAVVSDPPDIISSLFFTYDHGYQSSDSLLPGKGYWVQTNQASNLILSGTYPPKIKQLSEQTLSVYNSIMISDGNDNHQTLYFGTGDLKSTSLKYSTLPPIAPEGCFDVRFSSGRFIEIFPSNTLNQTEYSINIQSTSAPITIYWNIKDKATKYIIRDEAGQVYVLDREGSLKFTEQVSVSRTLRLTAESHGIPTKFALQQNYPNPFNPMTKIEYELPKTTFVSIKVFNLLGSEIATLVEGEKEAGYHSVDFNTSTSGGLPSGIYIYKMKADKFTSVKKMILMR